MRIFSPVLLLALSLPLAAGVGCAEKDTDTSKSNNASKDSANPAPATTPAPAAPAPAAAPGPLPRINGGGATFVAPIMQKWSSEYKSLGKAEIDYTSKGSGFGITSAIKRDLEFGCSDAPMSAKQVKEAKDAGGEMLHIPVAVGAVAVLYNLEGVKNLKLSGEVLAEIYNRKIIKWNDEKIKKLNPDANLPDGPITPVARNEASGTTAIFTEYLSKRSADFNTAPGPGTSPKWVEGVEKKPGSDGVTDFVKNTAGAIGYAELSYARNNKVPVALIVNRAGKAVAPTGTATTAAVSAVMGEPKDKDKEPYSLHPLAYSFTDAKGEAAYPIVGASYALLYKKQPKDKGPVLVAFLKWAVSDGQKFAEDAYYAPLPAELTKKAEELLGTVTTE